MLSRVTTNTVHRAVSQTIKINQKFIQNHRFLHSTCSKRYFLRNNSSKRFHQYPRVLDISFNRYASTQIVNEIDVPLPSEGGSIPDNSIDLLDHIPDPPPLQPIEEIINAVAQFHANGEPTLQSLGLGNFTPPGAVQNCLEWLHISLDIPWWAAIATGVVIARILIFPVMIYSQKLNGRTMEHMPRMQELQLRISEARKGGDQYEASKYAMELRQYMKEHRVNPLKNMISIGAQAPIFCSFFLGLRAMANAPVPGFLDGGLWWFTNLTVSDPYYALPLLTCATLALTIELGIDGINPQNLGLMKYFMRAMPIVVFPFMFSWPGAVLWYWCTNNFVSLVQAGVLKAPAVRRALKLPLMTKFDRSKLPMKPKKFIPAVKDAWTNLKLSKQLSDRQKADELQFANAGRGTTIKTYRYDPTKPTTTKNPIYAKKY